MGDNGSDGNGTLTVRDNRTGREYEIDIQDGDVISAMDLRQIKVNDHDFGMMSYDPAFSNTASTRSNITFIDGGKGILEYRGYPIDQLAEHSTFLEVAYLILKGELPGQPALDEFSRSITTHTYVHENFRRLMHGFRYDAHAMSMVISGVAALNTFYPDGNDVRDADNRWLQIQRLVAKMPTLAAYAYRHYRGLPAVYPENELSYTANFLNMLFRIGGREYKPNPVVERALDILFILHADHEQNCSTTTMRVIGSAEADPYSSLAGAMGALFGPLHGGANEAVLRMLNRIGSMDKVPSFIEGVKNRE
jgi:citrate synthase